MSYPKYLDEYTDKELFDELIRRRELIRAGKCSYCEYKFEECTCRMKRHYFDPVRLFVDDKQQ